MAILYAGNGLYTGLSSDTKASAPTGYRFQETDTGDIFVSDGTYWWLAGLQGPFSTKKVGYLVTGATSTSGTGVLSTVSGSTGAGSTTTPVTDTTNGKFMNHTTGGTIGNKCGIRLATATFMRLWNIQLRVRFKLVVATSARLHIGFTSSTTEPTGDDPLNAAHGFLWGMNTASGVSGTNWLVQHNDGSGATVVDDSTTAFDTNAHTIQIVMRDSVPRIAWKLDGGSYNNVTTELPGSTTGLVFYCQLETSAASTMQLGLFDGFIQSDK